MECAPAVMDAWRATSRRHGVSSVWLEPEGFETGDKVARGVAMPERVG